MLLQKIWLFVEEYRFTICSKIDLLFTLRGRNSYASSYASRPNSGFLFVCFVLLSTAKRYLENIEYFGNTLRYNVEQFSSYAKIMKYWTSIFDSIFSPFPFHIVYINLHIRFCFMSISQYIKLVQLRRSKIVLRA